MDLSMIGGILKVHEQIEDIDKIALVVCAGGTCAGKTYFAKRLQLALEVYNVESEILEYDRYFLDIDDPALPIIRNGQKSFDLPDSFHNQEIMTHIETLLSGESVEVPNYDILTNKRLENKDTIHVSKVLIVEGLYAIQFWGGISDVSCYIEAMDDTRMDRRYKRDNALLGVDEEQVFCLFEDFILPIHREYILKQKEDADIVINNG